MAKFEMEIDFDAIPKGATHAVKFNQDGEVCYRRLAGGYAHYQSYPDEWGMLGPEQEWVKRYGEVAVELAPLIEEHNFWKKAPEGATHYFEGGDSFAKTCWRKVEHGEAWAYMKSGKWEFQCLEAHWAPLKPNFKGKLRARGMQPAQKEASQQLAPKKSVGWW